MGDDFWGIQERGQGYRQLNPAFQARIGTVAYTSGDHYWVEFEDSDSVEPGFYAWWLEPTVLTEAELEAVAT